MGKQIFVADRLRASGLAACVALMLTATCIGQDRVYPAGDATATGKITSISPTEVKIEVRGKEQVYPIHEVRKIVFDDEPRGLDRAREFVLQGQFDQAIAELKKVPQSELTSEPVKQDFKFYVYYCQARQSMVGDADPRNAVRGLVGVARENPNTHHYFQLNATIGQLAAMLEQNARPYFARVAEAPDAGNKAMGAYLLGQFELQSGDATKARESFRKATGLSDTADATQRYKRFSEVGLTVCDLRGGDAAGALKKLDALVAKYDSTDQELFALISNARGACYVELGKPNQALVRYLQTDLMFFTDPMAHAEALYHLSKLWTEVGQPGEAADARARLQKKYASSAFAKKT
ncbi:MAG: hypothetical protein Aurels2KO_22110 [Aureliella sp.]